MPNIFTFTKAYEIASQPIITLHQHMTISKALQVLSRHHILSAPVLDIDKGMCVGSIDVMDLLSAVVEKTDLSALSWHDELRDNFRLHVKEAIGVSKMNPFYHVANNAPLDKIIISFLGKGIHRVPVVDDTNEISGIVTQFDVVKFLRKRLKEGDDHDLVELGRYTVNQMDLATGQVVGVHDSMTILQAFKAIIESKVRALAVVNSDGQLLGNLSAADFRGVTENTFTHLATTRLSTKIESQDIKYVDRDSTFKEVLDMIVESAIHRVYIVNKSFIPIGVISLTDIIQFVIKELNL